MANVILGGHNTSDWNLDFLGYTIDSPVAKTNKVSIPLRDSDIDMTEFLGGYVRYSNRKLKMRFELRDGRSDWPSKMATIMSAVSGQVIDVVLPNDTTYYWHGRLSVGPLKDNTASAGIEMELDANPFKISSTRTTVGTYTVVSGTPTTASVTISSDRAYLMLDINGNINVEYDDDQIVLSTSGSGIYVDNNIALAVEENNVQYAILANVSAVPSMYLSKGIHNFKFTGSGTVSLYYFGGAF